MNSNSNYSTCLQCGETQAGIKASQRSGVPVPCENEDERGRELHYTRHKFTWTPADQRAKEAREAQGQEKWAQLDLKLAALPQIIIGPGEDKP